MTFFPGVIVPGICISKMVLFDGGREDISLLDHGVKVKDLTQRRLSEYLVGGDNDETVPVFIGIDWDHKVLLFKNIYLLCPSFH